MGLLAAAVVDYSCRVSLRHPEDVQVAHSDAQVQVLALVAAQLAYLACRSFDSLSCDRHSLVRCCLALRYCDYVTLLEAVQQLSPHAPPDEIPVTLCETPLAKTPRAVRLIVSDSG